MINLRTHHAPLSTAKPENVLGWQQAEIWTGFWTSVYFWWP